MQIVSLENLELYHSLLEKEYLSNITANGKRITNLEKGIASDLFVSDTTGVVPTNALPYAEIIKIGGMTYRDELTDILKDAKPTDIKCIGIDGETIISSLAIPEAVQALEGYGLGVDSEYCNYIDWENKQYIQRVCKYVVTGAENIGITNPSEGKPYYKFLISAVNNDYLAISDKYNANLISNHYMASGRNTVYNQQTNNIISIFRHSSDSNWIEISTDSPTTKQDMKTQLENWYANGNPLTVVYKLAEPIVTDISDLLLDDNFIEVEGGGTILTANENNLVAPTEIKYMLKEV